MKMMIIKNNCLKDDYFQGYGAGCPARYSVPNKMISILGGTLYLATHSIPTKIPKLNSGYFKLSCSSRTQQNSLRSHFVP